MKIEIRNPSSIAGAEANTVMAFTLALATDDNKWRSSGLAVPHVENRRMNTEYHAIEHRLNVLCAVLPQAMVEQRGALVPRPRWAKGVLHRVWAAFADTDEKRGLDALTQALNDEDARATIAKLVGCDSVDQVTVWSQAQLN